MESILGNNVHAAHWSESGRSHVLQFWQVSKMNIIDRSHLAVNTVFVMYDAYDCHWGFEI